MPHVFPTIASYIPQTASCYQNEDGWNELLTNFTTTISNLKLPTNDGRSESYPR
jgi:hypothetical protein